jgi:UTP--glucose-1-phosphate uridylyltransferase
MLMVDEKPCLASMVSVYDRAGGNVVAVEQCRPEEAHKFGIVSLSEDADKRITGMVEKPAPGTAPSNLYISGRYILQPEVFGLLESQTPGAGGEIQLTDAMIKLMETQDMRPYQFSGRTFDCGSPAGFVNANLHMAMMRSDLKDAIEVGEYANSAG